jgi:hypothetical protein
MEVMAEIPLETEELIQKTLDSAGILKNRTEELKGDEDLMSPGEEEEGADIIDWSGPPSDSEDNEDERKPEEER